MKIKRRGFVIIGALLAVCLLLVTANQIVNRIIENKIRVQLKQFTSAGDIRRASIRASVLKSLLTIENLVIHYVPDSNDNGHEHVLTFPHIQCSGFRFFKAMSGKQMVVKNILLENPRISVDRFLWDKKEIKGRGKEGKSLPPIIVSHVNWRNVEVKWHSKDNDRNFFNGTVDLYNVNINDSTDFTEKLPFKSIECVLNELTYPVTDRRHTVYVRDLAMNSSDETLTIGSVQIKPFYSKFEFGRKIGHQTDRVEATISGIKFFDADVFGLFKQQLIARKIVVSASQAYIFRDRRLPRTMDKKMLPAELMKDIPMDIRVQTVEFNYGSVAYEEFPADGNQTGALRIEKMHAVVSPFINHPHRSDPDYLHLEFSGSLMNSGTVYTHLYVPTRSGSYIAKGTFRNLNLVSLRSPAENLGNIRIQSGMLDQLDFHFVLSPRSSTGEIVGEYHNLVLQRLKAGKNNEKKVAWFQSFMLKHLIIPKNKDKSLAVKKRTGKVDYPRDNTRYFSHYLLQSLLTGIKASFSLGFLLPK